MDLIALGNTTRDNSELAKSYDRISNSQFKLGCMLVEKMNIGEGDQVLDIGCGTGRLVFHLSKIVGASGNATGIDPSIHRIQIAESKLSQFPHNVRFKVGSAENLEGFPGGIFDCVCYSSVLHWINDKRVALAEAYRVLKPGGKVGMATLNRDAPSSFRTLMVNIFREMHCLQELKAGEGSSKPVAVKELRAILAEAGFREIMIDCWSRKRYYGSPEEILKFYEASSFGNFMRSVPEDLRAKVRSDLEKELEKRRTPSGIEIESNVIFATAEK